MKNAPVNDCPGQQANRDRLLARRDLLKSFVQATLLGLAGSSLAGCAVFSDTFTRELFQSHYRDMTDSELANVISRLEEEVFRQYKKRPEVRTDPPLKGVRYVQAIDLSICLGCGRCMQGCFEENNQSRSPEIKWIIMLHSKHLKIWLLHDSERYTNPPQRKDDGNYYLPVGCQQCDRPACVRSCPVQATWKEPDGITVVDYNWCIGCRYCMAACPYEARKFNWARPTIPRSDLNPLMHYLGNRPRMYGIVEKCTFCIQRVRKGHNPACVDVCPVGARKFGDVNDPSSQVHFIVKQMKTIQLKEDVGTKPRFYYYFSAA